jgi:hypothetical protein
LDTRAALNEGFNIRIICIICTNPLPFWLKHDFNQQLQLVMAMSFRLQCNQCTIRFWNVPCNGSSSDYVANYCHECTIHWERHIYQARHDMLARPLSLWHLNNDVIVSFGTGSLHPLAIQRVHRRAAIYVVLVSPGVLRWTLTGTGDWDRSDSGPTEYRRNLLEKVITYLI